MATALTLWNKISALPQGKWTFSRMLCLKAPYFGSISPLFQQLKPQYCEVSNKKKRAVLKHLNTVFTLSAFVSITAATAESSQNFGARIIVGTFL